MSVQPALPESPTPLVRFARLIDSANQRLCQWISIGTVCMVIITFVIVVLRYGFNTGWIAMQESVMYLHSLVFMIGIAYTLKADGHVRVDVMYRKMTPRNQAKVNLGGALLLLIPVCIFIISYSFSYVSESWRLLETSPEPGGLPLVFVLKTLIPIMAALLLLQGISQAVSAWTVLSSGKEQ